MNKFIIEKAKKGDKDSFAILISEITDKAYRIAYCYTNNQHDSMDSVCNAVEKAFKGIENLKDENYFTTWFIRILINECKLFLKQKCRITYLPDSLYIEGNDSCSIDEKMDLDEMVNNLPLKDRSLINMKYYLGYSLVEISDLTGLPIGTVKTKIYGNLKKMKSQLELREDYRYE
jgi:RNA polymerase sigma-70 factor, ECF subfamily